MTSASRTLSGLFRSLRQDRLRADSFPASNRLLTTPVRFRWLVVLLAIVSFVAPVVLPTAAFAAETAPSAMNSPGTDDGLEQLSGLTCDCVESTSETFSGDYSHDTQEADKILFSFALHWDASAAVWGGVYAVLSPPDPVFSFERPPRPFFA